MIVLVSWVSVIIDVLGEWDRCGDCSFFFIIILFGWFFRLSTRAEWSADRSERNEMKSLLLRRHTRMVNRMWVMLQIRG